MDSSDSNSDCFEIRHNGRAIASSSPLTRKHSNDDDDENVSGMEAMLRRRKLFTTTTGTTLVSSSSTASKMFWSKNDELVILRGIVDYENETKLSYRSDWDAFYQYIKDSIKASFSKRQLMDKVKKLKKRFTDNQARYNGGKGLSYTNKDDNEVFELSMIIWATKNETKCASNENLDQDKVLVLSKDVLNVEHEKMSNVSMEIDDDEKEKEKSEEDGVGEFSVLQNALEETLFPSLVEDQQKLLLQRLRTLKAEERRELSDEWKALLVEELQLKIKKMTFSTKLASTGVSA